MPRGFEFHPSECNHPEDKIVELPSRRKVEAGKVVERDQCTDCGFVFKTEHELDED